LVNLARAMYNASMYVLASQLSSLPVVSLQSGETVATVLRPLIDAGRLDVLAYHCLIPRQEQSLILLVRDIREHAVDCLIIDSEEELTQAEDLVRLSAALEQDFSPLGKSAVTDLGRRVGRIEDYTINLDTNQVQKLYVKQSIFQSWHGSSLIVDRSQIVDVTPRQIIVRDTTSQAPLLAAEPLPKSNS
jgi:sporulation protein YlmC with PRC-barrel domain